MLTPTRQYGAAIALISGLYSLFAMGSDLSSVRGLVMVVLGLVVLVHGIILLTPLADRLAGTSGPLMLGYALVMLLNQVFTTQMDMPMGDMGGMGSMGWMGYDAGMVALAALMLVSGLIMTQRDTEEM